ncbi:MAG: DUF2723 domain-containing protein [Bdellovibrionales bacterium]
MRKKNKPSKGNSLQATSAVEEPVSPPTRSEALYAALLSGALPFFVYWRGLVPGLAIEGDSGEIITAVHEFGILHSPGFPGYMVAAKLFTSLLGWLDVAYATNLFSALCGALSSYWIFRLGRRLGLCWSALCLALSFAFAAEFWYASLAAEVYTFAILTLLWILESTIHFEPTRPKTAIWLGLALGFGFSAHVYAWALLPVVVVIAIMKIWPRPQRWSLLSRGLTGFGIGLWPYLYIPLRAGHAAYVNEGGIHSFASFFEHVSWILQRERVEEVSRLSTGQWLTAKFTQLKFFGTELALQWGTPGLALILIVAALALRAFWYERGKWPSNQRDFAIVVLASLVLMPMVVWVVFTGDSTAPGLLAEMAVHMQTFYLFLCLLGFLMIWKFKDESRPASLLVLLPIFLLVQRWSDYDLRNNQIAVAHAEDLIESLPPQTILLGDNDNDLMTITHQKAVRGQRTDVALLNLMNGTRWNYENYRKLYPGLRWPPYTPTYYGPLVPMNLQQHPVYASSWYGATGFLQVSGLKKDYEIIPIHGAFRLVEKNPSWVQQVVEDQQKRIEYPFKVMSLDVKFHLRDREVDAIAGRAEYLFRQAQYLARHQRPAEARLAIAEAFKIPTLNQGEYGQALIKEMQKLLAQLN